MKLTLRFLFALALFGVLSCFAISAKAADAIALPPVADLENQVDFYLKELAKDMEDLAASKDFAADANVLPRDANALTLIALAIGMSEGESKYKAAAPNIITAAQAVAGAKDLAAAQAAVKALEDSVTKKSDAKLEWKKVAKMEPVMKLAVPKINTGMGRYTRNDKMLDRGIPNVAGATAALAAIVQGLGPNYDETLKPDQKDEWLKLSHDFRDAALKANAAVHGYEKKEVDFKTFKADLDAMKASCEHCHKVFVPGAVSVE
ncbi:MAG: hypothetical protein FWC50_04690 [Planctomycetaceae bacterium]|nr:hypothetical protein [Planctomycetaceae bacterium]